MIGNMPEKSHTNDKGKNQEQYEGKMSDRKKRKGRDSYT
jgi:hypothetical protein